MTFQPIVPFGGLAGFSFLTRTRDRQQMAFDNSASIKRDTEYFKQHIKDATTAEQLVSDRRLLSVALGAFGLENDISNRFFIRKVLEDGTLDPDALANRLSDKRYLAFSKAFGFGDFDTANTQLSDFPNKITDAFRSMQFEVSIGTQDEDMRLALGLERDLGAIIARGTSETGKWFSVMGTPPVRRVFEVALGLPTSFGSIDIDLQLKTFREKSEKTFGHGNVSDFGNPESQQKLIQLFLIRSEAADGVAASSPGAMALALLRGA